MMKVHVKLQGTLPDHYLGPYPDSGLELEFEGNISVADLIDSLGLPRKKVSLVSVNGLLVKADDLIPDGAVVKLLQPLSGG
ncbi:MAG: sulfur carrier protein ThiS [Desulforhopalus sp.]|jgi:sulfur carrier protein ThiS